MKYSPIVQCRILHKAKSMERAGKKCEICTATYTLQIYYLLSKALYPQHRFEMMNTVIICDHCKAIEKNNPGIFFKNLKARERFDERLLFYTENKSRTNPSIKVDYETQLEELRGFKI